MNFSGNNVDLGNYTSLMRRGAFVPFFLCNLNVLHFLGLDNSLGQFLK
jgi:hypothetical protein